MLDIKKINNSVVVVSDDNIFYPNDNTNSYPLNSLMVVVDESDMAIFKSAANGDVLFSALIDDLTINGSKTSKDTIFNDLDSVISATQGGGGGGTVDAYTKAESDAKYGTKEEQESLRGDVENALGEIAALGYDKADKKDTYTKAEVDEKLSDVKGGDEHYKSVVTDGMGDAPVITVINGEIVTPDPTPNSDGITIIMQQGTWKFKRTNTSVPIFKLSSWEQGEAELGYWNNSKSCFVFRDDAISFENGFFSSEWLVNGKTIKKSFNVNFETGAELHFGTEWSESDSLEIRKIDEFNGQFYLENFGYAYADDLTPRRNYKTIDNAIEVDYRGDKYHLLPKEQLKTINGQSIVGTGNLTVTDSSIQSYSSGSATSGTYYKINGSAINKWNDKQDKLTAGDGITIEGNVISAVGGGGNTYNIERFDIGWNYLLFSELPWDCKVGDKLNNFDGVLFAMILSERTDINTNEKIIVLAYTDNLEDSYIVTYKAKKTDSQWSKVKELRVDSYQKLLKSGTNIKTINGESILGSGNIDIQGGGGDVDLSNYPTKQEVNQTYLQKEGEYVKSVTANGGAINFEKGNGTPDVVNLKTVGGQSIIGMDDIPVPTVQSNYKGSDKNYVWSSGDWSSNVHFNVVSDIKCMTNETVSPNYIVLGKRVWGIGQGYSQESIPSATHEKAGAMSAADKQKLDATPSIWFGTQTEYDALGTYDDNTLYLLREDDGYLTI